ncbi:MAG TPA: LON peptidase substrate-binding domain-containing protein [Thermoanaerobaculia bacterium]|jgi:hypothetical protein
MATSELPEILPIFPLTGVVLLPGGRLPLHVFELRYRNLVEDAMAVDDPYIGIIQPLEPTGEVLAEELPDPAADGPPLYDVGCAGVIERCDTLPDGRHLILLQGQRRFRIRRELPPRRGYRRVEADYGDFAVDDRVEEAQVPAERLMQALAAFGQGHRIQFELEKLSQLPGLALLNSVAMVLPFPPEEKQALLEAPDVSERYETLLTLMNMGIELRQDGPSAAGLN